MNSGLLKKLREFRKSNEHTIYQNFWDVAKSVPREKFMAIRWSESDRPQALVTITAEMIEMEYMH